MFRIQVEWLWQHIVVILLSFGSWIGIAYIVSASADIDQDFYYVSAFFLLFLYYLDYFYSNLYYWLLFLYCSSIVVVVIVVTTVMIWILLYLLYILYYNNILIHAYIYRLGHVCWKQALFGSLCYYCVHCYVWRTWR